LENSRKGTETWATLAIRMAATQADLLPLRRGMAVGNIPHSAPADTSHSVPIERSEFHNPGGVHADAMELYNRTRWDSLNWIAAAFRPAFREPWPLGIPRPLMWLEPGKGQGTPALTCQVVPYEGLFGGGDIQRDEFRPKIGEFREGPKPACQNSAWGGALLCPTAPFGAHGHINSHATCYMWCNARAKQGQPMGHGYDIRVILVHCD
jgi:hypothetical protein